MTLVKSLIAGTAIILTAPAFAADSDWHSNSYHATSGGGCDWKCQSGQSIVTNNQINYGTIWSKINADVNNIYGDVNATTAAVGNTVEVITMQDTEVNNSQISTGQIGAEVNAGVDSVDGSVNLSATALCNGADVSVDPNVTIVNNNQHCGAADPEATVNGMVTNVTGGVSMAATAVGNQFTTDSNASFFPVTTNQQNDGGMIASVNAGVANASHVELTATAVGNTAQIIHYSTH